jgi:hypothetical protein
VAGLTIQRCHQTFPPGTVVQARPEAKVASPASRGHGNKVAGAAAASATVQNAVPHLSFTGLAASTFYILTGVVGGELRRIQAMSEAT